MTVARTTGEARRRWSAAEASWRRVGEDLVAQIRAIELPALRHAVSGILDTIASGYGALLLRRLPEGRLEMRNLHLDAEAHRAIEQTATAEVLEQALKWLQARLHGQEVLTFVFLLGHLREEAQEGVKAMLQFEIDGFVYDLREQRLLGIRLENGRIWKPK